MTPKHLGEELPRLVDRLVASYHADPRTQNIDRDYLPSRTRIIEICDALLELTFPGYFGRKGLTSHNISYHVGELVPRLWELLNSEILHCLCQAREHASEAPVPEEAYAPCHQQAHELASAFVARLPEIRALIGDDAQAAFDGDPAATGTAEVILAYPAMIAIAIYRYAHELYEAHVPLMPRVMCEHAHRLTGIDIHPGARIGRSFFIDHGTGVVIGETTDIGDNVKIYQGVTLGALSFPKDERGRIIRGAKRHPTVGNNVTIYANAIVLGGQTVIGDGAVVGGSVFLTESVEPGHMVSITPPVLRVRAPRLSNDSERPKPPAE